MPSSRQRQCQSDHQMSETIMNRPIAKSLVSITEISPRRDSLYLPNTKKTSDRNARPNPLLPSSIFLGVTQLVN